MVYKSEGELFEDWNLFGERFHLFNEDILKFRADIDTEPTIPIHKNFTNAYKKLGDTGIINLEYTPEMVYPRLCLGEKIVYATLDGVWVGTNEGAAEILQNIPYHTTPIPAEEVLVINELIKTGKNEGIIWEYLTGSELDAEKLSKLPKGSKLGLSKTDWIGAAYFLLVEMIQGKKLKKNTKFQ